MQALASNSRADEGEATSRRWPAILLASVAACSVLPLFRLTRQSLWFDELFTGWVANRPLSDVVHQASVDGFTPPLYYLLVRMAGAFGTSLEGRRILSAIAGALFLVALARLATRLGGDRAALAAVLTAGLSPVLVGLSQELRPYTAFLAAATWCLDGFVAWRSRGSPARTWRWPALLVVACAFSYLGFALVAVIAVLSLVAPPRRRAFLLTIAAAAVAAALSIPGLHKGLVLFQHRARSGQVRWETGDVLPLARIVVGPGLGELPYSTALDRRLAGLGQAAAIAVLTAAVILAWRRHHAPLRAALGALAFALAALWIADATMGLGFPTRYLSLGFLPFVLVAGLIAAGHRLGGVTVAIALLVQLVGLGRYVFDPACARDDWRGAMARLRAVRQPGEVVLGFPLHHLAVAAAAYAPELPVDGGFVGRPGEPVYLLKPNARFEGYDLGPRLDRADDLPREARQRWGGRTVWLVTYEEATRHGDPDPVRRALEETRVTVVERFPGREVLVLRRFAGAAPTDVP